MTFNHGVAGSSPAALTKEIKYLARNPPVARKPSVRTVSTNALRIRGFVMSDELDWNFADKDDAKAEIRAAVEYLLRGTTGGHPR